MWNKVRVVKSFDSHAPTCWIVMRTSGLKIRDAKLFSKFHEHIKRNKVHFWKLCHLKWPIKNWWIGWICQICKNNCSAEAIGADPDWLVVQSRLYSLTWSVWSKKNSWTDGLLKCAHRFHVKIHRVDNRSGWSNISLQNRTFHKSICGI